MPSALQELRRGAGYKTADEYAAKMGIVPSTYKRYEREPEKIPTAAAWLLADDLGTTIDIIVGRSPLDGSGGNTLDALRESLSADNRHLLDEFASFVASRQQSEDDRAAEKEMRRYEKLAHYYDGLFVEDTLKGGIETDLAFASGREYRDRLEQFIRDKASVAIDAGDEPSTQMARNERSIRRIMEAYERLHPEASDEEGRCTYAIARLP